MIKSGIVIDEPWISLILAGKKTWEMRSTRTNIRGPIALIRKGSGEIVATANIVDCQGPLDRTEMLSNTMMHGIPDDKVLSGSVDKWSYAWVMTDIVCLNPAILYFHPKGAVIWVTLAPAVSQTLALQSSSDIDLELMPASELHDSDTEALQPGRKAEVQPVVEIRRTKSDFDEYRSVPFSKDGSFFGPHLGDRGYFQVGAKGEEVKYGDYSEALNALIEMPTARWRRPNIKGNWGIVAGVRWAPLD